MVVRLAQGKSILFRLHICHYFAVVDDGDGVVVASVGVVEEVTVAGNFVC